MPDAKQVVVTNTTPIIALSLVGHLPLLERLYGEVLVPPAVWREVLTGGGRVGAAELQISSGLRQVALADPRRADLIADLDRGEAEAIALAQELNADLLIIDERLGRRHARRVGLTITGTLGVLLRAKQAGYIAEVEPLIAQMRRGGIRLDDRTVARALQLAGEQGGE